MDKIAIIGGGPAGCAAAVQLKRSGFDVVIFEKNNIGGLAVNANMIENYLGFPSGINGVRFTGLLEQHIENLDIDVNYQTVDLIDYKENSFIINSDEESKFDRILIATGTKAKRLNIIGMDAVPEDKICYEVFDLMGEMKQTIGIIGGGDAAFDYALNLSLHNDVIILNRSDTTKSLELLIKRAAEKQSIKYLENIKVDKISLAENKLLLNCIAENDRNEESREEILLDYLLIACGRVPSMPKLSDELNSIKQDLVNQQRLFFLGDLVNDNFRQTSISAADGIRAAMEIKFDWDSEEK
jgi:thioredoxin reductase (NADPH)